MPVLRKLFSIIIFLITAPLVAQRVLAEPGFDQGPVAEYIKKEKDFDRACLFNGFANSVNESNVEINKYRYLIKFFMKEIGCDGDSYSDTAKNRMLWDKLLWDEKTDPNMFWFLLAFGVDPNLKECIPGLWRCRSLLQVHTNPEIVKLLIDAGVDISDKLLLQRGVSPEKIALLVTAGADVSVHNRRGQTPLHVHTDPKIINTLIAAGANVNACNNFWSTPLHDTLKSPEAIKLLIAAGADVNAIDNLGYTPLDWQCDNVENANIIESHGGLTSQELRSGKN